MREQQFYPILAAVSARRNLNIARANTHTHTHAVFFSIILQFRELLFPEVYNLVGRRRIVPRN